MGGTSLRAIFPIYLCKKSCNLLITQPDVPGHNFANFQNWGSIHLSFERYFHMLKDKGKFEKVNFLHFHGRGVPP